MLAGTRVGISHKKSYHTSGIIIIISCHRFSFFPGTSPLEPVVNPTTQASSTHFKLLTFILLLLLLLLSSSSSLVTGFLSSLVLLLLSQW
jgi:hypothetical protein